MILRALLLAIPATLLVRVGSVYLGSYKDEDGDWLDAPAGLAGLPTEAHFNRTWILPDFEKVK
jgi:hypothetical protein